jgi:hypothetical protein
MNTPSASTEEVYKRTPKKSRHGNTELAAAEERHVEEETIKPALQPNKSDTHLIDSYQTSEDHSSVNDAAGSTEDPPTQQQDQQHNHTATLATATAGLGRLRVHPIPPSSSTKTKTNPNSNSNASPKEDPSPKKKRKAAPSLSQDTQSTHHHRHVPKKEVKVVKRTTQAMHDRYHHPDEHGDSPPPPSGAGLDDAGLATHNYYNKKQQQQQHHHRRDSALHQISSLMKQFKQIELNRDILGSEDGANNSHTSNRKKNRVSPPSIKGEMDNDHARGGGGGGRKVRKGRSETRIVDNDLFNALVTKVVDEVVKEHVAIIEQHVTDVISVDDNEEREKVEEEREGYMSLLLQRYALLAIETFAEEQSSLYDEEDEEEENAEGGGKMKQKDDDNDDDVAESPPTKDGSGDGTDDSKSIQSNSSRENDSVRANSTGTSIHLNKSDDGGGTSSNNNNNNNNNSKSNKGEGGEHGAARQLPDHETGGDGDDDDRTSDGGGGDGGGGGVDHAKRQRMGSVLPPLLLQVSLEEEKGGKWEGPGSFPDPSPLMHALPSLVDPRKREEKKEEEEEKRGKKLKLNSTKHDYATALSSEEERPAQKQRLLNKEEEEGERGEEQEEMSTSVAGGGGSYNGGGGGEDEEEEKDEVGEVAKEGGGGEVEKKEQQQRLHSATVEVVSSSARWGSALVCADLTLDDIASEYWPFLHGVISNAAAAGAAGAAGGGEAGGGAMPVVEKNEDKGEENMVTVSRKVIRMVVLKEGDTELLTSLVDRLSVAIETVAAAESGDVYEKVAGVAGVKSLIAATALDSYFRERYHHDT